MANAARRVGADFRTVIIVLLETRSGKTGPTENTRKSDVFAPCLPLFIAFASFDSMIHGWKPVASSNPASTILNLFTRAAFLAGPRFKEQR